MNQGSSVPAPMPGDFVPPSEGGGAIGSDAVMFARADHQHPTISARKKVTLDVNGAGQVMFGKTYTAEPEVYFGKKPGGPAGPCIFEGDSWVMSGSDYVGINVKGYRLSPPTNLAAVQVLGISVAIGGQLVTVYGPANGVNVSVIALPNG